MSEKEKNPFEDIRAAFLEAVEMQLRENDPPETRLTLERLKTEGLGEIEAKEKIAEAIEAETLWILENKEIFNRARFSKRLQKLSKSSR